MTTEAKQKTRIEFTYKLKDLTEVGQTIQVHEDLDKAAISRALYYHGNKQGKKFGYIKHGDYFIVVLVAFRQAKKYPVSAGQENVLDEYNTINYIK